MKFRIEFIAQKRRPAFLFARRLEPGDFHVSANSKLGEVPIRPTIAMPRALTTEGEPDMTVFTFYLTTANDLPKLSVGQVVELGE
jgi:hypothetical protein